MKITDALADFTDALADLDVVAAQIAELPDSVGKEKHAVRLAWAKGQVATVQTIAVQITMATAGLKRSMRIQLPQYAEDIALYALKGGTATLAAVTWSARQFIHATLNPNEPPMIHGLVNGANWAGIGKLIGTVEGMRK